MLQSYVFPGRKAKFSARKNYTLDIETRYERKYKGDKA